MALRSAVDSLTPLASKRNICFLRSAGLDFRGLPVREGRYAREESEAAEHSAVFADCGKLMLARGCIRSIPSEGHGVAFLRRRSCRHSLSPARPDHQEQLQPARTRLGHPDQQLEIPP